MQDWFMKQHFVNKNVNNFTTQMAHSKFERMNYWCLKRMSFESSLRILVPSVFSEIDLAVWCILILRKQLASNLITENWWLFRGEQFRECSLRL